MKKLSQLILLIIPLLLGFNMASPFQEGTIGTQPFINEHVNITHENILIKIDEDFYFADYEIEYYIMAEEDGIKIPLLFYASDYYDGFIIEIDGNAIELKTVDTLWDTDDNNQFKEFLYLYDTINNEIKDESFENHEQVNKDDLLYFETDLSKGEHKIVVKYRATRWREDEGWVKKSSFRYSLAPAKYWKSFGNLNITIDASAFEHKITSNLDNEPTDGDINNIATWVFMGLPTDVLEITYNPKVDKLTQTIIDFTPFNIALVLSMFLVVFQLFRMNRSRRLNTKRWFSKAAVLGGIAIPIFFISTTIAIGLILENSMDEASGRTNYGYLFLLFLMPLYGFVYLIISIIVDQILRLIHKKNLNK
ncbi:MAG: hypothetical protein PSN34_03660 [Urechidicola sp.]|nr:hypothetical protein [Urechidicola sp.]